MTAPGTATAAPEGVQEVPAGRLGSTAPAPATRGGHRRVPRTAGFLWFAAPAAILLLSFSIYPILLLVKMSFSQVRLGTLNLAWPFVGLDNFSAVLQDSHFHDALLRTVFFVVIVGTLGVVGGVVTAVFLRTSNWATSALLALIVFVWALPPVVNGSVWKFLLAQDGLVNAALGLVGIDPLPFLFDPSLALPSVALVTSWAVVPFNALVFRAALLAIDPETLEAGSIDDASPWQEFWHIVLPGIRPTSVILSILTVVYAFRSFDLLYVMTMGGPGEATMTLPYLSYDLAFEQADFGLSAASGIIALVIVCGLALVYARSTSQESK